VAKTLQTSFLLQAALGEIEHLIGLVNMQRQSPDYGNFCAAFWRDKEQSYPNARCQEAVYALVLLKQIDHPDNRYYQSDEFDEIIKAGTLAWCRQQHFDGSFDEWRPNEHGQPPTAFGLYVFCEVFRRSRELFSPGERRLILKTIRRASRFLSANRDPLALNHEAAAVMGLASAIEFAGDFCRKAAIKKIGYLLDSVNRDGWLREVDGPDTGYNTVSLTCLGLAAQHLPDENILEIADKLCNFNRKFIYFDGVSGGGANSRYAASLLPAGYSLFAPVLDSANLLWHHLRLGFARKVYFGHHLRSDYARCVSLHFGLEAVEREIRLGLPPPPKKVKRTMTDFDDTKAEIYGRDQNNYRVIFGPGGSIAAAVSKKSDRTLLYSSPYRRRLQSGMFIRGTGFSWGGPNRQSGEMIAGHEELIWNGELTQQSDNRWDTRNDRLPVRIAFRIAAAVPPLLRLIRTKRHERMLAAASAMPTPNPEAPRFERTVTLAENSMEIRIKSDDSDASSPKFRGGTGTIRLREILLLPQWRKIDAILSNGKQQVQIGNEQVELLGTEFTILFDEIPQLIIETEEMVALSATPEKTENYGDLALQLVNGRGLTLEITARRLPFSYKIIFP
jgi:hypothetical protein